MRLSWLSDWSIMTGAYYLLVSARDEILVFYKILTYKIKGMNYSSQRQKFTYG